MATKPNGKYEGHTLLEEFTAKFAGSGLTRADCQQLQVRPITVPEIVRLPNIPSVPHNPGALIPYFDLDGQPLQVEDQDTGRKVLMYRLRYLPPLHSNGNGFARLVHADEQKYNQPLRVGCPPYLPPLINWRELASRLDIIPWITEGEIKASCATKYGQPTIGTGGVWNFKGKDRPLHDLFYQLGLQGRTVVQVRDSDWITNHNVRYGNDAQARALADEGATVYTLTVPSLPGIAKTGLDDFLVHGASTPQQALEVLQQYIQPWVPTTMNDTANATLFKQLTHDRLFFCTTSQSRQSHWRHWNGIVWEPSAERALQLTDLVHAQLAAEAAALKDEKARKRAAQWAISSGMAHKRQAILTLAEVEMDRKESELDADPMLLNLQNDVLNLRTFELLGHDPTLMQGRASPASYDSEARCPEFDKFIKTILPYRAVRDFVQRLAGYFLIGGNPERIFVNFWGEGRNGKTQLKEMMLYCGGNYAQATSPDTFLSGRRTGTVRDDLNALRGARLVVAVEPNKIAEMDESTVKEVTGGDTIATRALYGQYQNWKPNFKPLLVSNHKLTIRGTDDGIWDRLVIVPFNVRIPDNQIVRDYFEHKLKPEVDGYLNWALSGLCAYWQDGLQIPDEVKALVQLHRSEQDVVSNFLEANCEVDPAAMAKDCLSPDRLKVMFNEFCRGQGIPWKSVDLADRLRQLGFELKRGDRRYWVGLISKPPKY